MKFFLSKSVLFFAISALFLGSCASPQKLAYQGKYDAAIEKAVKKLGKKNKKTKHIEALELAFNKSIERDLDRIAYLENGGTDESWIEISDLYRDIRERQTEVKKVLPIYVKGKAAKKIKLNFVDVGDKEVQARKLAAGYLYKRAGDLLVQGRAGDREAARDAYSKLVKLGELQRDYENRFALLQEARDLGTAKVFVAMQNTSGSFLPPNFAYNLLNISIGDSRNDWVEYHTDRVDGVTYDFDAVTRIDRIVASPEQTNSREYIDETQVADGFEYILDSRGNVLKDSLGNDVKRAKTKTIRAWVTQITQAKGVEISGTVDLYDNQTNTMYSSRSIFAEAIFENEYGTYRGEADALSSGSRTLIRGRRQIYPSNEDMLSLAAEELKPEIRRIIEGQRRSFVN